jgi:hypothetical protein
VRPGLDGRPGKARTSSNRHRKRRLSPKRSLDERSERCCDWSETDARAKPGRPPIGIASDALVDDRVAKRNRNGVRPRVRLELREDVPHVALDGLLADEEFRGDVRVRHAVGE